MSYKAAPAFLSATIVGVAGSAAFSSLCWGISYLNVPSLLLPAANVSDKTKPKTPSGHLARQWQLLYDIGKFTGPPVSIISASSLIYAMTCIPVELKVQRQLYITAAALIVSIMPFTLIVLAPTNAKLLETAAVHSKGLESEKTHLGDVAAGQGQGTPELISKWAKLNAIRGIPPVLGIGCVLTALNL
jgi:hypothetical protein